MFAELGSVFCGDGLDTATALEGKQTPWPFPSRPKGATFYSTVWGQRCPYISASRSEENPMDFR